MLSRFFMRFVSIFVSLSILSTAGAYASVQAPVSVEDYAAAHSASRSETLAKVEAYLSRGDVASALERMGVAREDAMRRVAGLNDAELAQLAGDIDAAPAGGIIGAIVFVFLVLLVTDILGFTKVYPFTRSIR